MNIASIVSLADTWGMHGDDVGAGWMIVMVLLMVLFWGAIIFGIVWAARGFDGWRSRWGRGGRETPIDILERRLAEGAISTEEYRERRQTLTTETHGPHPA